MKTQEKNKFYEMFCIKDNLIDDVSFEELITTIKCNEKTKTREDIKRVFNELLEITIENARETFNANYENIKKELN